MMSGIVSCKYSPLYIFVSKQNLASSVKLLFISRHKTNIVCYLCISVILPLTSICTSLLYVCQECCLDRRRNLGAEGEILDTILILIYHSDCTSVEHLSRISIKNYFSQFAGLVPTSQL